MPASDVTLPLRIGARTLVTLRRRLRRSSLTLTEALASAAPRLPEVTVRLTSGSTSQVRTPAEVIAFEGDPAKKEEPRIGIRVLGDSNVFNVATCRTRRAAQ